MQNNSNRCPFCAEKDLRIDGTCTHTPTGSPSTPPPAERCPVCGWPYDSLGHRDKCDESAEPAAPSLKDDPIFGDNPTHDHVGRPLPAKAPQLSQAECERLYAETLVELADLIAPAAAEVRESISVEEALAVTITLFKECQTERDQLRRELESAQEGERFYRREWESACERYNYAQEERDEARAECERLRAACKRNPSSGSCIAALGNGGT